jgi:preprotein translocase subunit SecE
MENTRKWVLLSYGAFAALVAYVLFALMQKAAVPLDLETRIKSADVIIQGVAIGLGLILFLVLASYKQANVFMDEVFAELGKVTWPATNETSRATGVVIVMVIISGLILGGLDSLWTWILKFIL